MDLKKKLLDCKLSQYEGSRKLNEMDPVSFLYYIYNATSIQFLTSEIEVHDLMPLELYKKYSFYPGPKWQRFGLHLNHIS